MIVAFRDIEMRDLCEDQERSILIYGKGATNQLQNRLSDLFAAENLLDVLVGNLREIRIENEIHFLLDLDDNYVLDLIPNHIDKGEYEKGDIIERASIKRVKIVAINKKI